MIFQSVLQCSRTHILESVQLLSPTIDSVRAWRLHRISVLYTDRLAQRSLLQTAYSKVMNGHEKRSKMHFQTNGVYVVTSMLCMLQGPESAIEVAILGRSLSCRAQERAQAVPLTRAIDPRARPIGRTCLISQVGRTCLPAYLSGAHGNRSTSSMKETSNCICADAQVLLQPFSRCL